MADAETSWKNLVHYSYDSAKLVDKRFPDRGEEVMQIFIDEEHDDGIRGHASGKKGDKPNSQTSEDLEKFSSWFKKNWRKIKEVDDELVFD